MEILITMSEDGKFSVEKSDGMPTFIAVGMLELAKKIMFESNKEEKSVEVEGQIAVEEVTSEV